MQVIGDIVQTGGLDTSQPAKVLLARDNRCAGIYALGQRSVCVQMYR